MSKSLAPVEALFEKEGRIQRHSVWVPAEGALSDAQRAAIVACVQEHMRGNAISMKEVARGVGLSDSYISQLLSNAESLAVSAARRDQVLRLLNDWCEQDGRGREVRRPENFVMLLPAKRLFTLARNVHATRDMGLAYGPPGIGKTLAARAVAAELAGTILVTVGWSSRRPRGLIRAIWAALRNRSTNMQEACFERLTERLEGSGRLLLLDQGHELADCGLNLLRDLHDAAGLPILLLGTINLRDRLADKADAQFGQLSSRVGLRCNLLPEATTPGRGGRPREWISAEELKKIFERGRVKFHADALRMLLEIANHSLGHLRRAARLVRWGEQLAVKLTGQPVISTEVLQKAVELVEDEPKSVPFAVETTRQMAPSTAASGA